ncbi:flavin reductase family protein [Azospirillum griseum]|uniref:Flavin reductase n=1 Tax=Azospirillum griseum TaxID=2496639 RepID=A0A3S0I1C5_9PROT|nr:flavin reductase family protein [Azospirillum griseum]RTR21038.1 flavin reductase [Azospirillum griseum]
MDRIDPRELRTALGAFATGVTVVTTIDSEGQPRGFTANSFTSVSLDPPLVLVCLAKGAASRPVFEAAAGYAVNILAEDQREVSRVFASRSEDRFASVTWHPGPAGNPVFAGTSAWLDCTLDRSVDAGDHIILIGQVRGFGQSPVNPLGYCRGAYITFGLDQTAMTGAGRHSEVGVILERDGAVLLLVDQGGGLALPTAAALGKPGQEGGLRDRLQALGGGADIGFLFAVFEDDGNRRQSIYYRGTLSAPPTDATARLVPFDDIPWDRLPDGAVRSMLRRYVAERREDRFGIYVGDAERGTVQPLSHVA